MRRDTKGLSLSTLCAATVAALSGVGCDEPVSVDLGRVVSGGEPLLVQSCAAGPMVTGGGWIDPPGVGKTTFGLTVHVNDQCEPVRGQLQVVDHRARSLHHSTEISMLEAFDGPEGGACSRWRGSLRMKQPNGSWETGTFDVEACDNGQPGKGRDTFSFTVEGRLSTGQAVLEGGNIQVRGGGNGTVPTVTSM